MSLKIFLRILEQFETSRDVPETERIVQHVQLLSYMTKTRRHFVQFNLLLLVPMVWKYQIENRRDNLFRKYPIHVPIIIRMIKG